MRLFALFTSILIIGWMGCEPDCESPFGEVDEVCTAAKAPVYHPGEMTYGRVAGLKNCLPFAASATAFIGENNVHLVGLSINTYEDWENFYANKEFIMIGSECYGKGIWPLLKDSLPDAHFQSYSTVQDHDVFEDVFQIDTNYEKNRIIITHIDTLNKIIQGSFDARFLLSSSIPSGKNPDTVIFTNCNFIAEEP